MQDKLKSLQDYEVFTSSCNSIELINTIREISFNFESQKYQPVQVHEMIHKLCHTKQSRYVTTSSHLENLTTQVELMEACGGTVGYSQCTVSAHLSFMNLPLNFATANLDEINEAT